MDNSHDSNEPVAWLIDNDYTTVFCGIAEAHRNKGAKVEPLYTSPPASKPWVGLTDEEREELMDTYDVASTDYAQAIEAKLREKNA